MRLVRRMLTLFVVTVLLALGIGVPSWAGTRGSVAEVRAPHGRSATDVPKAPKAMTLAARRRQVARARLTVSPAGRFERKGQRPDAKAKYPHPTGRPKGAPARDAKVTPRTVPPDPAWVSASATAYPGAVDIGGQLEFASGKTAANYSEVLLLVRDASGTTVVAKEVTRSDDPTTHFDDQATAWCYGWWANNGGYPQFANRCFWAAYNGPNGPLNDGEQYFAQIYLRGADGTWSANGTDSPFVTAFYTPDIPGAQVGICSCYAQAHRADPVDTATGTFFEKATDAELVGSGKQLSLDRYYRSDTAAAGLLGPGWSTPFDSKITSTSSTATLLTADGAKVVFHKESNGTYTPPAGAFVTLTASGGTYTVEAQDHSTSVFNGSGVLTALRDASGHGLSLAYTSGRLSSVTDAAGRVTQFTVGTDGRLDGVALPDTSTVGYGYTGGLLTSVTDPAGKTTAYGYDTGQRLTTVTAPGGGQVVNTYDTDGRVLTQKDANDRTTHFHWDGTHAMQATSDTTGADGGVWSDIYSGNVLMESIDPYGRTISYDYDAYLRPVDITDRLGNTTTMTYDPAGNMLTRQAPSSVGYAESWTYDTDGNVLTHTDGRDHTTTYHYTAGRLDHTTDPDNHTTHYTYDTLGALASVQSPLGKTTTYGYDTDGNRTSVTLPNGEKSTFSYDDAGHVTLKTDPRGNVSGADPDDFTTSYTYDPRGMLKTATDPLGNITTYVWDDDGLLHSVEDALHHTTTYAYYPDGSLHTTTDPAGKVTTDTYDAAGNLASVTDPLDHTTSYTYDKNGLLLDTVTPRGNMPGANAPDFTTSYGYDGNGNRTTVTDPTGAVTTTGYDALNRPTTVTDPLHHTTTTGYDADDNATTTVDPLGATTGTTYTNSNLPATRTDPLGKVTRYVYDADGNQISETSPLGFQTTSTFDDDERLHTQVDPRGNVSGATPSQYTTTYDYDPAGNLTTVTDALGKATHTEYDALNRAVSVTDPLGHVTKTGYDELGRIAKVTGPDLAETSYTYDPTGTLATRKDPNGHTTTYDYDDAGRPTSVTDPLNRSQTVGYDADGNATTTTDARGTTATTVFDGRGLPAGTTYSDGTPAVGFTYDTAGQQHTVTDATGTRTYGHDADGQLTSITPSTGKGTFGYEYDPAGRITTRTQDYTPGAALDWTGATQTAAADLNGDGVTDTIRTDASDGIRTFLGRQYGTFTTGSTRTGTGTGFHQVVPTEFTGDGKPDLLAIDQSTGHLYRYNGDGAGGFAAAVDLGSGWGAMTLTAGDFNGDGKQDFFASNSTANELYFYPGTGTGTFGTRTDIGSGWSPYRLTALDFNGDGKRDLLAVNTSTGHLYLYPGTGTGGLGTRTDLGTGWAAMQLVPGDVNGDGKADFLALDTANHRLRFYPGKGDGTFGTYTLQADDWTSYGLPATGKFDAGSTLDIVATDTAHHLRTWRGDGAGHLTGATVTTAPGTGARTTYGYDADSRQTAQTGTTGTTAYGYDAAGNLTSTVLPAGNGHTEKRGYDHAGRLTSIGSTKGATTLVDRQLTLDDTGRPTRVDITHAGQAASHQYYTYDPAGRLLTDCTSPTQSASCPDPAAGTMYTYDSVGNRETATTGGTATTYTYDDADELTTAVTGATTRTYTWDDDGNQTGDGTNTFAYDADNRLSSLTTPSATYTYGYNAQGNRTNATKTGSGPLRTTVWDPNNALPQIAAEYGATGTLINSYQYDPQERIQAQTTSTGTASFHHHDQLGSVTDLTDAAGTLQTSYDYTAFGETTRTDSVATPPTNRFTFTGQYTEPTTQAAGQNLRARDYSPTTGRLTTRDPVQLRQDEPYTADYTYAGNGPTYAVDPSGQDWTDPITSRIKAIGSGLKEGAELPFTFVGDLTDALTGANGGAGGFLDKYLPVRPAYRFYRAADMLREQGCDQLADRYDAVGDQYAQQLAVTVLGGVKGAEDDPALSGGLHLGMDLGPAEKAYNGLPYYTPETPGSASLINPEGGRRNCVLCSLAGDDHIAGKTPQPAPGDADLVLIDNMEKAKGRPFYQEGGRLSAVVKEVLGWGPGGRGFVAVTKGANSGHVFNVVNLDGKVVFLDYQLGKARPAGWVTYYLMRTD